MAEVLISAGAEQDYAEALAWYLERSTDSALGLEVEFDHAVDRIGCNPLRFQTCDGREADK